MAKKRKVTFKSTCTHCLSFKITVRGDDTFDLGDKASRVLAPGEYRVYYLVDGAPNQTLELTVEGAALNGPSTIRTDEEGIASGRRTLTVE
jgi:hypothetical protein